VTKDSATLNGTVNPQGSPTTYHFEYGTSTAYGSATPQRLAGSDTADHPVSQRIGGYVAAGARPLAEDMFRSV